MNSTLSESLTDTYLRACREDGAVRLRGAKKARGDARCDPRPPAMALDRAPGGQAGESPSDDAVRPVIRAQYRSPVNAGKQ